MKPTLALLTLLLAPLAASHAATNAPGPALEVVHRDTDTCETAAFERGARLDGPGMARLPHFCEEFGRRCCDSVGRSFERLLEKASSQSNHDCWRPCLSALWATESGENRANTGRWQGRRCATLWL